MLFVKADKVRAKQVLLNLISNGIKYNRVGGTVTLSVDNKDDNFFHINNVLRNILHPRTEFSTIQELYNYYSSTTVESSLFNQGIFSSIYLNPARIVITAIVAITAIA